MGTITTAPSRYNYYDEVTYPERAYNNSSSGMFTSTSLIGTVIYDKCSFSDVPANAIITGYKLTVSCKTSNAYSTSSSHIRFRLVTDYYQGATTSSSNSGYTSISTSYNTIFSVNGKAESFAVKEYENTDTGSEEIIWMNNNINTVLAGTQFGIRITAQRSELRYLKFILYYQLPNESKIYVAESQAKEVYVGGTKASAVYIGSTKIL